MTSLNRDAKYARIYLKRLSNSPLNFSELSNNL